MATGPRDFKLLPENVSLYEVLQRQNLPLRYINQQLSKECADYLVH